MWNESDIVSDLKVLYCATYDIIHDTHHFNLLMLGLDGYKLHKRGIRIVLTNLVFQTFFPSVQFPTHSVTIFMYITTTVTIITRSSAVVVVIVDWLSLYHVTLAEATSTCVSLVRRRLFDLTR